MVTIQGPHNPIIATLGGVTYAISGANWIPVSSDTTLADVQWDRPAAPKVVRVRTERRLVSSARDPKKQYEVIVRSDGVRSCTCSGFMYRRQCRHINDVKKALGWS